MAESPIEAALPQRNRIQWLQPQWPAPAHVRALTTLRTGGCSTGPFASLNLGLHVGDDAQAVRDNRDILKEALGLPAQPAWLNQVHGATVWHCAPDSSATPPPTADAAIATQPNRICAILTADCLPVLLCDRHGTRVGAAHAGWRGLAGGVIRETVAALGTSASDLMAWLGPAIEAEAFEVGDEVREQFVSIDPANAAAFVANHRNRWQADIYLLARLELQRLGVQAIFGGGYRCYADRERFFSYRRDGQTGRMASLIWRTR